MTKIQNRETQEPVGAVFNRENKQGFEHLIFGFWICFGFRASDFDFTKCG
jgi:hypothetical protein